MDMAQVLRKDAMRAVTRGLGAAIGLTLAGMLILAALGLTNMWVGVFADVGVAVLAILNAMRTLKAPDGGK